jgi:hypothetical protein
MTPQRQQWLFGPRPDRDFREDDARQIPDIGLLRQSETSPLMRINAAVPPQLRIRRA